MAPKVCILDMRGVKLVDITGLSRLMESLEEGRRRGIKFVFTGLQESLEVKFTLMDLVSDITLEEVQDYIFLDDEGEGSGRRVVDQLEGMHPVGTGGRLLRSGTMVSLASISSSEHGEEEKVDTDERRK